MEETSLPPAQTPSRVSVALPLAFVALVTALYGAAIVRAFPAPISPGDDWFWTSAIVVTFAAASIAARRHGRVAALCVGVALGALLLGSQRFQSLLTAGAVVAAALAAGLALSAAKRENGGPFGGAERIILSLASGLAMLSGATLLLAWAGLLRPWAVVVLLAAAFAAGWRELAGAVLRLRSRRPSIGTPEQVMIAVPTLLLTVWALVPEVQWDALYYHLPVARAFAASGRAVDLPYFWASYSAHLSDMLFALVLTLSDASAAKLLVYVSFVTCCAAVFVLGRRLGGDRAGWLAAALFATTPMVVWVSSTAYVDTIMTLYLLASACALLRWRETLRLRDFAPLALLLGAAAGTKAAGIFPLPAFLLVAAWTLWRRRPGTRLILLHALAGILLFAALAVPYYAMVGHFTGNPFFPLFNKTFRSPLWEADDVSLQLERFGLARTPLNLLRLPFVASFAAERFDGKLPAAGGAAFALLPLGLWVAWRRRGEAAVLCALVVSYLVLWASTVQVVRYCLPAFALLFVLAAVWATEMAGRAAGWARGLLLALALLQAMAIPSQFFNVPERFPVKAAFRLESDDAFLRRAVKGYRAVEFLNRQAPGRPVVGHYVDNLRYYVSGPLYSYEQTYALRRLVAAVPSPASLAAALNARGIKYLVARRASAINMRLDPIFRPDFLERYARIAFADERVLVFELRHRGNAPPGTNLLANSGFEDREPGGRPRAWGAPATARAHLVAAAHRGRNAVVVFPDETFVQSVPVRGGREYVVEEFARQASDEAEVRLQVNWVDAAGQLCGVTAVVDELKPSWQQLRITELSPPRAVRADFYANAQRGAVLIDDCSLFPLEQAAPPVVAPRKGRGILSAEPNPVARCGVARLGRTLIRWSSPEGKQVEVRVGSPNGALFASKAGPGQQWTGDWVTDGMRFFLVGSDGRVLDEIDVRLAPDCNR